MEHLENTEKAMEDEQHLLDDNHDDQVQIMTNGTMVSVERELAEKIQREFYT